MGREQLERTVVRTAVEAVTRWPDDAPIVNSRGELEVAVAILVQLAEQYLAGEILCDTPWQPIDSAPYRQFVLVARDSGYVTTPWCYEVARFNPPYRRHWTDVAGDATEPQPLWWRPLPTPPPEEKQEVLPERLRLGTLKRVECELGNLLDNAMQPLHQDDREVLANLLAQVQQAIGDKD